MNCRVPVTMEWNGRTGPVHFESTFTRVVNSYGCLVISSKEIELQEKLRLTNLSTQEVSDAVVVWKGTKRPDGWDLGVELLGADMGFWGIDL